MLVSMAVYGNDREETELVEDSFGAYRVIPMNVPVQSVSSFAIFCVRE